MRAPSVWGVALARLPAGFGRAGGRRIAGHRLVAGGLLCVCGMVAHSTAESNVLIMGH